MHKTVKEIRNVIKHIPGAWVRRFSDNEVWAGYDFRKALLSTPTGTRLVCEALEAAGYKCEMNGMKGTVGEYIINVIIPPQE